MRRPGHDEWVKLVSEYESSELSQKEFAAKHDVSIHTLRFWLYKTTKKKKSYSDSSQRFLPVEVVTVAAPKARQAVGVIEAAVRGGIIVRFPVGTDTNYLAELLAALG